MSRTAALLVAAVAALTACGAPPPAPPDDGAVVQTDSGPVLGTVHPERREFHAVPYAAPPVGDLRWTPPRPPEPWTQPRPATVPVERCAQGAGAGRPSANEDCLYLDVVSPDSARHEPKPVMVWLHGGGLTYGSASDVDAGRLAVTGDVVVVAPNYRLGVFGFFGHPALDDSGGFGLQDQIAALRWVQRNAAAFGGDPGNVTVFGESGGAFATCALLTAPDASGLFHRAAMQSGSCTKGWPRHGLAVDTPAGGDWLPLAQVEHAGATLAEEHGCTDPATALDCLRRVPARALTAGETRAEIVPVGYGTRVLPERPDAALAAGRFHRVPVLSGTTRDEGALNAGLAPQPFTEQTYQRVLAEAFGEQAPAVAARYPSTAHGSPVQAWSAVVTDRVFACQQLADEQHLAAGTTVWGYEFADRQAPSTFPFPPGFAAGAFHASELPYLFDLVGPQVQLSPDQQDLADVMVRYWARFAATGDPNGPGLPHWPRFDGRTAQSLAPGATGPVDLAAEHACDFWAGRVSAR